MEALGPKLRRQRRRLGLTLDELAAKAGISKPYLSLIETGRVTNPPSDEKLRRLEQTLGFKTDELLTQAHLQRTPRDVRNMLAKLIGASGKGPGAGASEEKTKTTGLAGSSSSLAPRLSPHAPSLSIDLDAAYVSGVLHHLAEQSAGNVERVATCSVPVINRVSAGYPRDFTDLAYPKGIADDYVGCPDVQDADAFAARVHGDSMFPKYREGDIVIFSPAVDPRSGDDCFVRFEEGDTTFKRVFFETDDSGQPMLRLQPRNEKYPPRVVASQSISGLYKAVFRYQRVDDD